MRLLLLQVTRAPGALLWPAFNNGGSTEGVTCHGAVLRASQGASGVFRGGTCVRPRSCSLRGIPIVALGIEACCGNDESAGTSAPPDPARGVDFLLKVSDSTINNFVFNILHKYCIFLKFILVESVT